MKKFNTIEEIRNEIDKLDLKIVELISQRKDLVSEVVKLKRKEISSGMDRGIWKESIRF